jgi:hypothetical protein
MKSTDPYLEQLGAALDAKIKQLDTAGLPQLKDQLKIVQSAFQGIQNILLKKGIIHDDPYRFDMKFSEVSNPPEGAFIDSERTDQMSIRISQFSAQIDLLLNYYQFTFDFLTMDRVKRILGLIHYFNFSQMTVNSSSINTRVFTEMVDQIRKGSDTLSSGVMNDAVLHLDRSSKAILQTLKEIAFCHKESLKRELRELVIPLLNLEREYVVSHQDEALRQIRRKFAETFEGRSFFPELATAILQEDYSQDSEALRRSVLKELEVKSEAKKDGKQVKNFRLILMEGVRILASISLQLGDADRKLEENSILLESERNTFWMKLKKAMKALFSRVDSSVCYEIDFTDPVTTAQRTEKLDFTAFRVDIQKKSRLYASLSSRSGSAYQRLEAASEDQAYSFIEKNIEELQVMLRRLSALDLYFRSEVKKESRARIHGTKLEIEGLKNTIIKANQKKHEYVAQREELEQMKRLGIKVDLS